MTENSSNPKSDGVDAEHDSSEDVENDAVIASAMRTSLIVFILLGIPVIGVLIYLNVTQSRAERVEVEQVTLPEARQSQADEVPDLPMVDVTKQAGIRFVHETGRDGDKLLPETMGSGVAIFDYNNDGHLDILFVNSSRWPWDENQQETPCRLYAGNGDMTFKDVTEAVGLNFTHYGMGVAVGDIDNDGDSDLFLSAVGTNRLFRNDDGKFVEFTAEAGVGGDDTAWSTSSAFLDYNNDGLLDLFVCNYVTWTKENDLSQKFTLDGESRSYGPPIAFYGSFSYLYLNEGGGKFRDVSDSAGIRVPNEVFKDAGLGKSLGVAPIDVNDDGWIDIVVANDTVRNFLFQNNKDGTFTEIGQLVGIAYDRSSGNARGAMGIDAVVYREDGTIAIGIGNFANEASALYMTRPDRNQFVDAAMFTGFGPPTRQGLTFGLFFFDADLDGRLDIMGANGHLDEDIAKTQRTQRYEQAPQLFWNAGREAKSELVQVSEACTGKEFCEPIVGRGTAYGDLDGDGDQDIVISVSNGSAKVFRNDQAVGNAWLRIRLQGTTSNRDAIGAKVTIEVDGKTLIRRMMPTRSYLSQSENVITFGLGPGGTTESATVQWPGGKTETFSIDAVDQTVTLTENGG